MKKKVLIFFMILTGLKGFALSGVVQQLSGVVELKAPGSASFRPANIGDRVSEDTIISTGFKSTALLELGSAIITVRPLTRLTLMEISASSGTETLSVNLQSGRIRVDVNPPSGTKTSMAVTSPIATASVRGTSFEFDTRNLHAHSGKVSFRGNRGRQVLVGAGSGSRAGDDGRVSDPVAQKRARFRPKAPVGTDSSGGTRSGTQTSSNGSITIEINYPGAVPAGMLVP